MAHAYRIEDRAVGEEAAPPARVGWRCAAEAAIVALVFALLALPVEDTVHVDAVLAPAPHAQAGPAHLVVDIPLTARQAERVAPGAHAEVRVPALPGRVFAVTIGALRDAAPDAGVADRASHPRAARAALPAGAGARPGMRAYVRIPGASRALWQVVMDEVRDAVDSRGPRG